PRTPLCHSPYMCVARSSPPPSSPLFPYATLFRSAVENRGPLATAKRVLTIHNLGYQGTFSSRDADYLDLSEFDLEKTRIRDGETLNFLKAGIWCADGVTTVSPGYAEEILQPKLGFGLDDFLRAKKQNFVGILNGMDYSIWKDRKSTRLNSSHVKISYAVFC